MNERGHVMNAVLLSIGLGVIWSSVSVAALEMMVRVGPPIVLGLALALPFRFDNPHYVWIGITTHYVLDLLGNVKGMGVFYPLPGYYDIPVGVNINSKWADVVTLAVTAFELIVLGTLVYFGHEAGIAGPDFSGLLQRFGM